MQMAYKIFFKSLPLLTRVVALSSKTMPQRRAKISKNLTTNATVSKPVPENSALSDTFELYRSQTCSADESVEWSTKKLIKNVFQQYTLIQ